MMRLVAAWCVGVAVLGACAGCPALEGVVAPVARNVAYAPDIDGDSPLLKLDVYAAEGASNQPVMVYIHGGGWKKGDKAAVTNKPTGFLARGYVFVSSNYRMLPDVDVATCADDVARAVAWVRANIGAYGGDPGRIYLMGHSAGAHLAALVGTNPAHLWKAGLELSALKGVFPIDTRAYDIAAMVRPVTGKLPLYYQGIFGNDPAVWETLSPAAFVKPDAGIAPMAVAYSGENSSRVAKRAAMAEAFVDKLLVNGIPAIFIGAPEKSHRQINVDLGLADDEVTREILAFIAETEK